MEPKPSRLPRRITVQPSTTSPLSARRLRGGIGETYRSRDSSLRHDSDFQDSSALHTSSTERTFRERDSFEPSWKTALPSYQRYSGTYDRPLSSSLIGSRSRTSAVSTSTQPSWYDTIERTRNTYSGLHSQQQEQDSKRPKLSYSGIRTTSSGLNCTTESSSRYGRFPRTSSVLLGTSRPDPLRERERVRRPDSSITGLLDYNSRNGDLTPSSLQDRVPSYTQGARPKENSLSTVRLNTSINHQLPSQHSSSLFNRDSSRISRTTSGDMNLPERNTNSEFQYISCRKGTPASSERTSTIQRSVNEQPADTEGRRNTRHLLSRLASSMSSTFLRRSSQDSTNGRQQEAAEVPSRSGNSFTQPDAATSPTTDVSAHRSSEQSQGFAFLRRRRWGLSTVSPNTSSDSDAESYRSEDSETRTAGSWLPSSLRNRCTPLFSRRRREGRDETARASSTSDTNRTYNPLRRISREEPTVEEAQRNSQGAAANSFLPAVSSSSTSNGTTLADSIFNRRNSGISGMLPSSLLHFSMPAALGNSLSDNVMITVDIVPAGRASDGQEHDKNQNASRDPEKLKKIQESLLLEDSEEEEDDLCRICQMGMSTPTNPFIEPCKCAGSLQYVHQECMKKWLHAKINSGSSLETITTCELCKEKLDLNLEDFDVQELYRTHANERAEYEFISSGLYLVVLLHLCEQRFSDMLGAANEASTRVRFINLARTLQAHMDDLETSEEDSEDEGV